MIQKPSICLRVTRSNCRNLVSRWRIKALTVCSPSILKCMHRVLLLVHSPVMFTLKSEASQELSLPTSPKSATQELENWEHLVFEFDMDHEPPSNSRNPQRSRSTSSSTNNNTGQHNTGQQPLSVNVQDAALLAQFAAAAGSDIDQAYPNMLSQSTYPSMNPTPGFYGNFMHHSSMPPPQLPPLSSLDFPWPTLPPHQPQPGPSHYDPRHASSSANMGTLPFLETQYSSAPPAATMRGQGRRGQQTQSPGGAHTHTSSSPEGEQTEAISEEKRRRNTAASARFRIKKKHKTISLERSVSDLTGRAEELEREASDLRRENGWLKEIVMLKGTRFAASNLAHRQALSEAAALATGQSASGPSGSSSAIGPSGSSSAIPEEESASESSGSEPSEDEEKVSGAKGKGKKPSKNKK
ncbi:hypothetical protein BDZ97DRAFT_1240307 [Flammula alnicola]|nr:hypothetical protein BDZ97DRAFT_1240307 [Flammula alnicola]